MSPGEYKGTPRDSLVATALLDALRHRHVMSLIRSLRRKGLSRDDAEDLKNEAFMLLFAYAQTNRIHNPRSLVRRTILNRWITRVTRSEAAVRPQPTLRRKFDFFAMSPTLARDRSGFLRQSRKWLESWKSCRR